MITNWFETFFGVLLGDAIIFFILAFTIAFIVGFVGYRISK